MNPTRPQALTDVSDVRAMRLTTLDRALLTFAAEHRFVLAGHIAAALQTSASAAGRRLSRLAAGGYLQRDQRLAGEPPLFQVTRAGLGAIESDLPPPPRVDLGEYRHDAGVAWLAAGARRGLFGPVTEILGDRRMQSLDRRREPHERPLAVSLSPGIGSVPQWHRPDLVLRTASGHRVAFELELTTKSRHRRERILSAYAADRSIDAVVYLVDRPAVGRALEESIRRLHIADRVRVENVRFDGAGRRSSPADRVVQRRTERETAAAAQR